jgi:glycosyltransferase involved in cell wall biosynthesis
MKILHIIPYYKPAYVYGGPVQSVSSLVEAQVRTGAQVTVFTTTANGNQELDVRPNEPVTINGAKVYYFKRNTHIPGLLSIAFLQKVWSEASKFEVVHVHNWWNLCSILTILICRIKKIKPVFSPRGMLSLYTFANRKSTPKRLFQQVLGNYLLKGTVLHATSKAEAEECRLAIPNWPFFVLPNILTLPDHKPKDIETDDSIFKLIFLSRVHPKKGLERLFQALKQVDFQWTLQIVGSGEPEYVESLKTFATSLGVSDHIEWKGWIGDDQRYDLLATADLFVLISENENFANVVIESLSVGTPVMISTEIGLKDFIEEHQVGWVTPLKETDVINTLHVARQDKTRRNWIRTNAPDLIRDAFSSENLAKSYLAEYRAALQPV